MDVKAAAAHMFYLICYPICAESLKSYKIVLVFVYKWVRDRTVCACVCMW